MGTIKKALRHPSLINYSCPSCSKQLSAPNRLAGRRGFCSCGSVLIIPDAGSEIAPKKIGKIDLDAHDRFIRRSIIYGSICVLILSIVSYVAYRITRDTWEADNRARIFQLCDDRQKFVSSREYESAKSVQQALASLIDGRQIADQELAEKIAGVKQTEDDVNRKAKFAADERQRLELAKAKIQERIDAEANRAAVQRQMDAIAYRDAERVTRRKFNAISDGMETYEVWDVMKDSGELIGSSSSSGFRFETRQWKNQDGSNMIVTYMNGKVTSKAQARLPY